MSGTIEEKRALVFKEFERCLDLEVALEIVPLTDEERVALEQDSTLDALVRVTLAKERANLIEDLHSIKNDADESGGVRLAAIDKLGKMFYPKKFKESVPGDADRPIHVVYDIVEKSA